MFQTHLWKISALSENKLIQLFRRKVLHTKLNLHFHTALTSRDETDTDVFVAFSDAFRSPGYIQCEKNAIACCSGEASAGIRGLAR